MGYPKASAETVSTEEITRKLAALGRRVVEARLYARIENARRREIVRCVYDHINASASELHERLDNIVNGDRKHGPSDEEVIVEILKLRD